MEHTQTFTGLPKGQDSFRSTFEERFQYHVKVQPVADRLEFSIRPVDTRLQALAHDRAMLGTPVRGRVNTLAADPLDSIRRSKLRARSMVRLLALEMRIDRMFTFTIRYTGEPVEYETVLKAWDTFRRMVERCYPTFRYLATPELQRNGQWHIHAGTRGFLNVNILRRCWQSALNRVLGRSQLLTSGADSPGHVHVGNKGPVRGDGARKSSKIAGYIAKYIGKNMDLAMNRKKYFHSYGVKITQAQRRWLEADTRDGALLEVMGLYGILEPSVGLFDGWDVKVWNRDACSAWFYIPIDSLPPPF